MPVAMHKIGVVFVFQWYAMFIYWQFLAVSLGETVFDATPEEGGPAWDAGDRLERSAERRLQLRHHGLRAVPGGLRPRIGAKRVHAVALGLAAVSLIWLAHIDNQYVALVPMIGVGIFWASAVGVPYLMVASMVPAKRTGVYMGILNMMIVVPMLIADGHVRLDLRAPAGRQGQQRDHARRRPAGHRRRGDAVGEPAGRGGRVADRAARQQAQHHRVRPGRGRLGRHPDQPVRRGPGRGGGAGRAGQAGRRHGVPRRRPGHGAEPAEGAHRDLYGAEAAREALEKSVTGLTKERARYIEQRLVAGDPAQALLDTVGANPANLIVVGNRGLGASEGQLLGSVPADVVKNAVCDVLVVQTSALDEDRMFAPGTAVEAE